MPVNIEAEAHQNSLVGGAAKVACGPCAGGWRVGYIAGPGQVVVPVTMRSAGSRTIRVTYETDGLRQLKIRLNGIDVDVRWLDGTGWEVPYSFEFTATLNAGPSQLVFYNDVLPAPDIDRVLIS
jgi:alpha-glucosidase